MSILPFAVASVSSLISYQRAKAESLGLNAKGGLMERAERIIALCIGLLFQPLLDPDPVDHARAHLDHGDPAVRQGVEAGRGGARHGGPDRDAPRRGGRAAGSPAPNGVAHACPAAGRERACRRTVDEPSRRLRHHVVVPARRTVRRRDARVLRRRHGRTAGVRRQHGQPATTGDDRTSPPARRSVARRPPAPPWRATGVRLLHPLLAGELPAAPI